MNDTRTTIAPGSASMIKGETITMVNSLAADTYDILRITNLLNKFPIYTADKEGDSQTLRNDENFKPIIKYAYKYNRDRILIYHNVNNLPFKPSFKTEIFEDISEDPFPTSGPNSGSVNINPGTGPRIQPPYINIPKIVVTTIEDQTI